MHILQLGPYPPPEGGINRNMLAIRDELLAQGHRCSIIATSLSTKIAQEPNVYHPRSPFALIKLLFTVDYDALHLHVGGAITQRLLALIYCCGFFRRGKNILSFHSGGYTETTEGKSAKRMSIRGFIFRRFARIVVVNPLLADVFERYGIAHANIRVIYPYVHRAPDKNVAIPNHLAEFARQSNPFLLTVGLLEDEYDLFMQIDAMEGVLAEFPDAGLMLVGSGSLHERLANAIAAKPYADSVFLADDVDHAVTLHLINDCDILLRTTLFDGDAISVREALFLDTPVIATDNGMRPGGLNLIPIGDKAALIETIKTVANSPRKEKSQKPSDNKNILDIVNLYKEIL
jgi:glycosyltransferase involved in cell wall biosynthesis